MQQGRSRRLTLRSVSVNCFCLPRSLAFLPIDRASVVPAYIAPCVYYSANYVMIIIISPLRATHLDGMRGTPRGHPSRG